MKKVIVLGANNGQIPFIVTCQRMGAEVIAVSVKGDYPGFKIADRYFYCDIRDKEKVLEIAEKECIDAILTDQTDVSVPTAAYVAEKLGLKGIGYDTAKKFSDKYLMRREAQKAGIAVPRFGKAKTYREVVELVAGMRYPLIVKPTDSSGSRGVHKINQFTELYPAVQDALSCSGSGTVIVEEFIQGREYIVDGLALDYSYMNTDLGIKEYFNKPNKYISKMCMFSSPLLITDEVEKKVLETNKTLVEHMTLKFGITHGEYIYCESDGRVYLVEIAARGGGVYLSSDLTPLASGIHTNEIIIDYILNGRQYNLKELKMDKKVSAWRCFELSPGIITKITGVEEAEQIKGVYKVCLEGVHKGQEIYELTDDTRKHGPILVYGNSREECFESMERVKEVLKIETTGAAGIREISW